MFIFKTTFHFKSKKKSLAMPCLWHFWHFWHDSFFIQMLEKNSCLETLRLRGDEKHYIGKDIATIFSSLSVNKTVGQDFFFSFFPPKITKKKFKNKNSSWHILTSRDNKWAKDLRWSYLTLWEQINLCELYNLTTICWIWVPGNHFCHVWKATKPSKRY